MFLKWPLTTRFQVTLFCRKPGTTLLILTWPWSLMARWRHVLNCLQWRHLTASIYTLATRVMSLKCTFTPMTAAYARRPSCSSRWTDWAPRFFRTTHAAPYWNIRFVPWSLQLPTACTDVTIRSSIQVTSLTLINTCAMYLRFWPMYNPVRICELVFKVGTWNH